jgi:hypothetical protein
LSELIGTLAGIVIGFGLDRTYTALKRRKDRKELKQNLKQELERCNQLLTGMGNLLPTIMWTSTITSGDIGLLSFNDRTILSSLYFEIDNHNYEAKRVRDTAVIAQTNSGNSKVKDYWEAISFSMRNQEIDLRNKILKALEVEFWK